MGDGSRSEAQAPLVLVVDDEPAVRRLCRDLLAPQYRVVEASDGRQALRAVHEHRPDLVLLDVMMPELDGMEALRRLRAMSAVPVIMLTARSADADVALGLDTGAQDYVVKPFRPQQLLARIRAALRDHQENGAAERPNAGDEAVLRFDDGRLAVDLHRRTATVEGRTVTLSATEYRLLALFARNPDRVLSHDEILRHVWGADAGDEAQYLHSYVRLLRQKIERDPRRPRYLHSRRGLGYYLDSRPAAE